MFLSKAIFNVKQRSAVEKKFKADNGIGNIFWALLALVFLVIIITKFYEWSNIWSTIIYFIFTILFILTTTIKEYAITELNFIEIRFILRLFVKNKRIPVGDIVGLKKVDKNQIRLDLVRGFEILRVNQSEIDEMIAELVKRNPRIKVVNDID